MDYEDSYLELIDNVFSIGTLRRGRNGKTLGIFGVQLNVHELNDGLFPLLNGRKLHYDGVLGELAAFFRGPEHKADFKEMGCNYWDKFANQYGELEVDYGNMWRDFNGCKQLDNVIESIKTDPHGRRHLITGWNPPRIPDLSLPCCHYAYQWYVTNEDKLDMIWIQRSVDLMIGLPSDVILAATWNILMAHLTDYEPGSLVFQMGDVHIYEEHFMNTILYVNAAHEMDEMAAPRYNLDKDISFFEEFLPSMLLLSDYNPAPALDFILKV